MMLIRVVIKWRGTIIDIFILYKFIQFDFYDKVMSNFSYMYTYYMRLLQVECRSIMI